MIYKFTHSRKIGATIVVAIFFKIKTANVCFSTANSKYKSFQGKPYFFSWTSWKDGLSEILCWNIFLVLSGKMIFLIPQNMILLLGWKMKGDFSQKSTWKYDIFFRCFEKIILSKRPHWNVTFLVLSGKMIFIFSGTRYFLFERKKEDDLSQEIHGGTIFSVYTCKRYKGGVKPLRQKKRKSKEDPLRQKYT